MKLDYSLQSPEERLELVNEILKENPNSNLETLANYLIFCMEKEERKNKKILTDNRLITVNLRETSLEGITESLASGEDGLYNLSKENDKNVLLCPKISITKEDIATMPELRQIREAIEIWQAILKKSTGRNAYIAKTAIIELRRDQYLVKQSYKPPINIKNFTKNSYQPRYNIDLTDKKVIQAILANYSRLKQESYGKFEGDTWYLMLTFDELLEKALFSEPILKQITQMKIDGLPNSQIKEQLFDEFGISYTEEWISNLWRNKIPNLIVYWAEEQEIDYHYLNIEKGKYKKCNRCGQIKLALPRYFSKNSASKDGLYSICKECRNKKK